MTPPRPSLVPLALLLCLAFPRTAAATGIPSVGRPLPFTPGAERDATPRISLPSAHRPPISATSAATVNLSFPLDGFHRPGRYMPVRIDVAHDNAGPDAFLALQAPGAPETCIALDKGRAQGVVPFLPLGPLRQFRWVVKDGHGNDLAAASVDAPWRSLNPDQRLVGFTTLDLPLARELFPDKSIVPVPIDPDQLFAASPVPWTGLDAIVLDAPPPLDDQRLSALLASGLIIALRAPARPDSPWPYRASGPLWLLGQPPLGPRLASAYPQAFAPVQGWQADWPLAFRLRILLVALLFAILLAALTLLRTRFLPLLFLLASALLLLAIGSWWRLQSPLLQRAGQIIIPHPTLTQTDTWRYQASASRTQALLPWQDLTYPFFEDYASPQALALALFCRPDAQPAFFQYRLAPHLKIAFLTRSFHLQPPPSPDPAASPSPLARLAAKAYLHPGAQILGQALTPSPDPSSSTSQWWPSLLLTPTPPLSH